MGIKLSRTRDLLLVLGIAGAAGFMLAGVFYSWALLVGLLLMASVGASLYFGYRNEPRGLQSGISSGYLRALAGTAFVMGVGLAIFFVFTVEQGKRNVDALVKHIAIYEPNTSIEWVPRVDAKVVETWMLETDDTASDVIAFYLALGNRDGWTITSHSRASFISMYRGALKASVMAGEAGTRTATTALIRLERRPGEEPRH